MRFVPANLFLYFFLIVFVASGFLFPALWPQAEGFYTFIAFAAVGGLGVAIYIYYTKRHHKQLACPVGSDCNAVITSRYSKFLGVSLEYWGMLYYAIIFLAYGALILAPGSASSFLPAALVLISTAAFFFSLYLLFVQAFLLRQWCIWCLLSATLSIIIFIVSLISLDFAVALLAGAGVILGMMHQLGFVFGMGGATVAVLLFYKFLRDFKIDEKELRVLKGISELIWLGLALSLVAQLVWFVASVGAVAYPPTFFVQTLALFVAAVGSVILMIIFAPLLEMIPFGETPESKTVPSLKRMRKPLFLTGAAMYVSWIFAFVMDYVQANNFSYVLISYAAALAIAIIISLARERKIVSAH